MTFSLIARCRETGQFGVAAATAMPAVSKLLTHAVAGVGAARQPDGSRERVGDWTRRPFPADEVSVVTTSSSAQGNHFAR